MKVSVAMSGAQRVEKMMERAASLTVKDAQAALKSAARILCIEYGAATDPPDIGGEVAVSKFAERIGMEIARVYPARDNSSAVYRLFFAQDPVGARAWYHKLKSGKLRAAADMLRAANLPEATMSATELKRYRTGRKGRVRGGQVPVGLVRKNERKRFIKGQVKLIGTAKAGWLHAAKALGGRVRREGVEAFPKYVRAAGRVPGLGGALVGDRKIVIWTNVRHAVEAMNPGMKARAESIAQDRFGLMLDEAQKARALKINASKTA